MTLEQLVNYYNEQYQVLAVIDLDQWANNNFHKLSRDIERELMRLYQASYEPNQRILFTANTQNHQSTSLTEIIVCVCRVLYHVDITKCFVTVLLDQAARPLKPSIVAQTMAHDSQPLTVDFYESYTAVTADTHTNQTMCMYPWTHLFVNPDGRVFPCCSAREPVGNSKTESLQEIWNGTAMKKLRRAMIQGVQSASCVSCYENEANGFHSARHVAAIEMAQHRHLVPTNAKQTTVPDFRMYKWDVRFNNLCNLKCRQCHHACSSAWFDDAIRLQNAGEDIGASPLLFAGRNDTDIWQQLVPHFDWVERIYFAGGEPLIMAQHYNILDELVARKKTHVKLTYNTNFTQTEYRKRSVFDYWNKFSDVTVMASLDDQGARGEYIRYGSDWEQIELNRKRMKQQCPHVVFKVMATANIFNLWSLPDFHRACVEKQLVDISNWLIIPVLSPEYLRVDILPVKYRDMIEKKYHRHQDWMQQNGASGAVVATFRAVIDLMHTSDNSDLLLKFWSRTRQLDDLRGQNVLTTFPELQILL